MTYFYVHECPSFLFLNLFDLLLFHKEMSSHNKWHRIFRLGVSLSWNFNFTLVTGEWENTDLRKERTTHKNMIWCFSPDHECMKLVMSHPFHKYQIHRHSRWFLPKESESDISYMAALQNCRSNLKWIWYYFWVIRSFLRLNGFLIRAAKLKKSKQNILFH